MRIQLSHGMHADVTANSAQLVSEKGVLYAEQMPYSCTSKNIESLARDCATVLSSSDVSALQLEREHACKNCGGGCSKLPVWVNIVSLASLCSISYCVYWICTEFLTR